MSTRPSSSDVSASNSGVRLTSEAISDEDLLRGFTLALGASGRVEKTLRTYGDSVPYKRHANQRTTPVPPSGRAVPPG